MNRLLGAGLLVLGAGLLGQLLTGALRQKREMLRELTGFLRLLRAELLQRGTPLAEIFQLQARQNTPLKSLWQDCAVRLHRGIPARQAMKALVESVGEALPEAGQLLRELSRMLGNYDGETQAEHCLRVCLSLEEQEKQLQAMLAEKGRLYRALSLSLGAVLALMLW